MLDIAFILCVIVGLITIALPQAEQVQPVPEISYASESFDTTQREE